MPSHQKKVIFCIAGLLSFGCALSIAAAIGTQFWVKGTILCKTGAQLVNATGPELDNFVGEISYGLFHGQSVKQCGLGGRPFQFSFFPDLLEAIPASIHVSVILFSAVVIIFSLVAAAFFMYNAFGNPYETLHGPLGLYLWNFISCSCSCLVIILFASEVKLHRLSEKIANYKEGNFVYKTHSEEFDRSFWIILFCFTVHFLNILLIRVSGIQFPFQESKETDTSTGAADLMY
ncbi:clarin-1-like [Acipenser oxyrinchus oxyrinchus]|uniref:Clarin-1-like n=1 Tax=Acipenser oxyrinchus oxyrinchus TaxID=40147 RepID=A0AAD8DF23_ACIOX|nr:clarin-1-like [Acipenser oxyrinchus oxyrinchus]